MLTYPEYGVPLYLYLPLIGRVMSSVLVQEKEKDETTYLLCQQGVERRITKVTKYREASIRGRYNKEVEALFLGASDGGKD